MPLTASQEAELLIRMRGANQVVREGGKVIGTVKGVDAATDHVGGTMEKTAKRGFLMNQMLFTARRLLYGVTLAAGAAAGASVFMGLKFNATMEMNRVAMTHFLGSTAAANKELDILYDLAAKTPFEFPQLTDAARKFLGFGFTLEQTNFMLKGIGDAVAGLGLGAEAINRITIAFGQMQAKGRVQGDELLQLMEAGIPAAKYLQEQLGLTGKQVGNIGRLGLRSGVAIEAILKGMAVDFEGAAEEQSKTTMGMLSTLHDYTAQLMGTIMNPLSLSIQQDILPSLVATAQAMTAAMKTGGINAVVQVLDDVTGAGGKLFTVWLLLRKAATDLWTITKIWMDSALIPLAILVGGALYIALYELGLILGVLADHTTTTKVLVIALTFWFVNYKIAVYSAAIAHSRLWKTQVVVFLWTMMVTAATKAHVFWLTLDALRTNLWIRAQIFAITVLVIQSTMLMRQVAIWGFLTVVRLINTVATWLLVAAQWALNIAMYAFPGTWIALAILAVVLAVYYMITHWKETKAVLMDLWNWVKTNWPYLAAAMLGPIGFAAYWAIKHWDTVKGWFSSFFNWLVDKAEWAGNKIKDKLNPLNWRGPGIPFFDLSDLNPAKLARHAYGGYVSMTEKISLVGERGPELVALPTGSRVIPTGQPVLLGGGGGRDREPRIIETKVYLNKRQIAKAVHTVEDDEEARR